jgi:hypothetical protein
LNGSPALVAIRRNRNGEKSVSGTPLCLREGVPPLGERIVRDAGIVQYRQAKDRFRVCPEFGLIKSSHNFSGFAWSPF